MPKNFRRVPNQIIERLQNFSLDDVVIATAKRLRPEDIQKYSHLGLGIANGNLIVPEPFVPNASAGKYSKINIEGLDYKRIDLPKIQKEICFFASGWKSRSTHLVCNTREVYQVDFVRPKEVELSITLLEEGDGLYLIKFAIEQVINKHSPDFKEEILYNLNILQENVGSVDVFPSQATLADYAATIRVEWELLAADQLGASEAVTQLLAGKRHLTAEQRLIMEERIAIFKRLRPTHFICGSSGFVRYFGAKYADDFIVFENARYGNAIYVMHENWQELSQKSRMDLLKGNREQFERLEHRDGWEDRLEAMLQRYRQTHRLRN
jgi:hypothetical protein